MSSNETIEHLRKRRTANTNNLIGLLQQIESGYPFCVHYELDPTDDEMFI